MAYLEQFTFLSAIIWQTIIGHHNVQKLLGVSDANHGVKPAVVSQSQVLTGYGLPAIWSLVTATVEMTGPRCADYKPRFGERSVRFQAVDC